MTARNVAVEDSAGVELDRAQTALAEARQQTEAVERQKVQREATAADRVAQAEQLASVERAAESDRSRRLERGDKHERERQTEQEHGRWAA